MNMLNSIINTTKLTVNYTGVEHIDSNVMTAMRKVDRRQFVPRGSADYAFENMPLDIGHGQTISQPFIVALMTHVVKPNSKDTVLEIGTGSGYQAAILAELVDHVYTIEIVPELAKSAKRRLTKLGYENVSVRAGDGFYGWLEAAPFSSIIVTAVAEDVPPSLIEQLAIGGRLVMPIGDPKGAQNLVVVRKLASKPIERKAILPVQFVPLTGDGVLTLRTDEGN